MRSTESSHRALSYTDGIASGMSNVLLLVARVLIALLFLMTAWFLSPNAGYLGSLGVPNPAFWSGVAITIEFIIVFTLILGVATRYGALLGILYVIIATAFAHRYWECPPPQQLAQYTNFTKNLAILGGLLLVFAAGAGRFSIDRMMSSKGQMD
jgi:putative oxidoreductase